MSHARALSSDQEPLEHNALRKEGFGSKDAKALRGPSQTSMVHSNRVVAPCRSRR